MLASGLHFYGGSGMFVMVFYGRVLMTVCDVLFVCYAICDGDGLIFSVLVGGGSLCHFHDEVHGPVRLLWCFRWRQSLIFSKCFATGIVVTFVLIFIVMFLKVVWSDIYSFGNASGLLRSDDIRDDVFSLGELFVFQHGALIF